MVDSISGHNINEIGVGQLNQNQQVERLNRESSDADKSGIVRLLDYADISDAALNRLNAEKDLMKFSSLASRLDESFDDGKVAYFKDLLDSGRINDYLRGLSNEALADDILNSPLGASIG